MLLQKYRENKEALKQIGREALAESRRLGLPISAKDLERKPRIEPNTSRKSALPLP
ncbi:hypothetical protein [Rhizobium azibense]|uniref:Uncharacterized protein n=1 Tax=Rhizobium azibense TaxID=1136135 RepID=A0A4R3QWW5_9HYPH|nr:hypothetical protein [Rhizobium azibense]TCU26968.1 hypothetical protein EV129_1378 [Rhizobium azibense]